MKHGEHEKAAKNGGQAFPVLADVMDADGRPLRVSGIYDGMTLRDYFAAKAMQANWQTMLSQSAPKNADSAIELMARVSYKVADAMLEARK